MDVLATYKALRSGEFDPHDASLPPGWRQDKNSSRSRFRLPDAMDEDSDDDEEEEEEAELSDDDGDDSEWDSDEAEVIVNLRRAGQGGMAAEESGFWPEHRC
jgi:hypothetical protein